MVYILVRWLRFYSIEQSEVVSVHSVKANAKEIADKKNSMHDAVQPYIYSVIAKKVK